LRVEDPEKKVQTIYLRERSGDIKLPADQGILSYEWMNWKTYCLEGGVYKVCVKSEAKKYGLRDSVDFEIGFDLPELWGFTPERTDGILMVYVYF